MDGGPKVSALVDELRALAPSPPILGLYLVGSHALDDVRPHSDIDFIGVLHRPPADDELSTLGALHDRLRQSWPQPHLDGDYVTVTDLRRPAEEVVPTVKFLAGDRVAAVPGALSPIEWVQLKRRGVRLLGPLAEDLDVHVDPEEIAAYCRRNLVDYWRPQVERLAELAAVAELTPWIADRVAWIALGIPRLLASIEGGEVLSKTEAGQYALTRFPEWRDVLEASLEQRREPHPDRVPVLAAMAPDVVAFGRRCIEAGLANS